MLIVFIKKNKDLLIVYVIVGVVGGFSGFGKISLVYKLVNIIGCEVVFFESYYKFEYVKDYKYDDFSFFDFLLLSKVKYYIVFFFFDILIRK